MKIEPHVFEDTRRELQRLRPLSFDKIAIRLGYELSASGFLSDVINGRINHVSHAAVHDLRRRLGLPHERVIEVAVPGENDAEIILRPGSGRVETRVVRPRTRKRYWRLCVEEELSTILTPEEAREALRLAAMKKMGGEILKFAP